MDFGSHLRPVSAPKSTIFVRKRLRKRLPKRRFPRPPNFLFSTRCQPKPATSFPELPFDSTCLYVPITATGQPKARRVDDFFHKF